MVMPRRRSLPKRPWTRSNTIRGPATCGNSRTLLSAPYTDPRGNRLRRFHSTRSSRRTDLRQRPLFLSPRIYQQEGLSAGPTWEQTQALIASASGKRPVAVRDRAILMLLAVYGLRSGDVSRLRLEDLDWEREILIVAHPKQRRARQYPLIHSVGEAIVAYFREVRPRCQRREVFLTLKQPFRPLSQGALWNVVGVRLKKRL